MYNLIWGISLIKKLRRVTGLISLIYGVKGSGKTKRIIDAANDSVKGNKGNVIYISDRAYSGQLNRDIRFVDATEYGVKNPVAAMGFIKGILASDNDITNIFIDGLARMADSTVDGMGDFYNELEKLSLSDKVDFIITVSSDALPEFLKKYV